MGSNKGAERGSPRDAMRRNSYTKVSPFHKRHSGGERRGIRRRSYEEQTRGTVTKTLSPVDGFPTGRARLAEYVSFVPDTFHSGSRLDKVPEIALAPEPPREVLTLGRTVSHAPCDVNWEDDGLIHLSGR